MRPALYILGGIAAVFVLCGLGVLSVWAAQQLFGDVWGLAVWGLSLMALGGGYVGYAVYRIRSLRP